MQSPVQKNLTLNSEEWSIYLTEYVRLILHLNCPNRVPNKNNWSLFDSGICKRCKKEIPEVLKIIENI